MPGWDFSSLLPLLLGDLSAGAPANKVSAVALPTARF